MALLAATIASCSSDLAYRGGAGGTTGSAGASGTSGATGAAGDDAAADAGPFCTQALGDCSNISWQFPLRSDADYCTLTQAIAAACSPCGPPDAGGCLISASISHGSTYTTVDINHVEDGFRLAYDASGALVALLLHSAQPTFRWECVAGPPDLGPEATSIAFSSGESITGMCAPR